MPAASSHRGRRQEAPARVVGTSGLRRYRDLDAARSVAFQKRGHLFRVMANVDDDARDTRGNQPVHNVRQQWAAAHRDERLGHRIGERAEPGSENIRVTVTLRSPGLRPVPVESGFVITPENGLLDRSRA